MHNVLQIFKPYKYQLLLSHKWLLWKSKYLHISSHFFVALLPSSVFILKSRGLSPHPVLPLTPFPSLILLFCPANRGAWILCANVLGLQWKYRQSQNSFKFVWVSLRISTFLCNFEFWCKVCKVLHIYYFIWSLQQPCKVSAIIIPFLICEKTKIEGN